MNSLYEGGKGNSKLRTLMSVAAALSVMGLASLYWLHDFGGSGASRASLVVFDTPATGNDFLHAPTTTGVPSAESVFGGAKYSPPEEPTATF